MSCCPSERDLAGLRSSSEITIEEIENKTIYRLTYEYGPDISLLPLTKIKENSVLPIAWAKVFSKKLQGYVALPLYVSRRETMQDGDVRLSFTLYNYDRPIGFLKLILKINHISVLWIENLAQDQFSNVGNSLMHFVYYASTFNTPYIGRIRITCCSEHFYFFTRWGASETVDSKRESIESMDLSLSFNAIITKNRYKDYRSAIKFAQPDVVASLIKSRHFPKK